MTARNQTVEPSPVLHHGRRQPATGLGRFARRVQRLGVESGMREVRVVHRLDGIERDVPPGLLGAVGCDLWDAWQAHPAYRPADLIVGLDAGGIIPALAVAVASRMPYRLAWKLDLDLPDKRVFHEPHARRPEVFVYGDLRNRHVLVIDDEVTTGRTVANLARALRASGANVVGVLCLIEDTHGRGRDLLVQQGLPLCALSTL